jgi:hypothetical protein
MLQVDIDDGLVLDGKLENVVLRTKSPCRMVHSLVGTVVSEFSVRHDTDFW